MSVFLLGFLVGALFSILFSILVFTILGFFRAGIEKRIKIIETRLSSAGPKPKGAIFLPDSEATIAREEHIKRNQKAGRDTNISELL